MTCARIIYLEPQDEPDGQVKLAVAYSMNVLDAAYEQIGDVPAFVQEMTWSSEEIREDVLAVLKDTWNNTSPEDLPDMDQMAVRIDGQARVDGYGMDIAYVVSMHTVPNEIWLFAALLTTDEADAYLNQIMS